MRGVSGDPIDGDQPELRRLPTQWRFRVGLAGTHGATLSETATWNAAPGRYDLQQRANEVLGRKEGTTLMELLPPVGWADVATKRDIDALDLNFRRIDDQFKRVDERFKHIDEQFKRVDGRFDRLESQIDERIDARFGAFNASVQTDLRRMQAVLLGTMTTLAVAITGIISIAT